VLSLAHMCMMVALVLMWASQMMLILRKTTLLGTWPLRYLLVYSMALALTSGANGSGQTSVKHEVSLGSPGLSVDIGHGIEL